MICLFKVGPKEHLKNLDVVLKRLKQCKVRLRKEKCLFKS